MLENFDINDYKNIVSPFLYKSFEFYIQNRYNLKIVANDKFKPLYNFFWNICKNDKESFVINYIKSKKKINKNDFVKYRNTIINETNNLEQANMYFIINRSSFSEATLSGGFSEDASKKDLQNRQ